MKPNINLNLHKVHTRVVVAIRTRKVYLVNGAVIRVVRRAVKNPRRRIVASSDHCLAVTRRVKKKQPLPLADSEIMEGKRPRHY